MNMEKTIKDFKSICQTIAFLALLQVPNLLTYFDTVAELDISTLDPVIASMMPIAKIIGAATIVLGILVNLYLCFKGYQEAKDPSPAKFHAILALVCGVFYVFATVNTAAGLFDSSVDLVMQGIDVLVQAASAMLMFFYYKYAKQIRVEE